MSKKRLECSPQRPSSSGVWQVGPETKNKKALSSQPSTGYDVHYTELVGTYRTQGVTACSQGGHIGMSTKTIEKSKIKSKHAESIQ